MKMLKMWYCLFAPWHKQKIVNESRGGSKKVLCSCGSLYGMNDDARAFLPWTEEMEKFFTKPDQL